MCLSCLVENRVSADFCPTLSQKTRWSKGSRANTEQEQTRCCGCACRRLSEMQGRRALKRTFIPKTSRYTCLDINICTKLYFFPSHHAPQKIFGLPGRLSHFVLRSNSLDDPSIHMGGGRGVLLNLNHYMSNAFVPSALC